MSSLKSYISSDYQKASNRLKSKKDSELILVYVESTEDVSFWHKILSHYEKQFNIKFDINCYSNSLETGKKNLISEFIGRTGKYLLICCDSDYDYLFPNHSNISQVIKQDDYIFQTYTYSIENLRCYAESLDSVCIETTKNTNIKIDFIELLERYSEIIYDLFIWNLYFYNEKDNESFTISNFCDVIKITENPEINENGKQALDNLKICVSNKLQELQHQFPEYTASMANFAKKFKKLGLKNTNTYLFIQGHTIYDNVVLMFLKAVCRTLKKEHIQQIKDFAKHDLEKNNHISSYNNLVGKPDDKVLTILSTNCDFKDCFLFNKIEKYIKTCDFKRNY